MNTTREKGNLTINSAQLALASIPSEHYMPVDYASVLYGTSPPMQVRSGNFAFEHHALPCRVW